MGTTVGGRGATLMRVFSLVSFTRAVVTLVVATASAAWAGAGEDWVSEPPITYVLDYGSKHLGHPEWLDETAEAPPTLLHLGKDVPMTHNWGPIEALGGENQAYGKGDYIRRLSPQEVAGRIGGLKAMVAQLHQRGVTMVMPYICSMTVAGHHQTRTGLWELYDHWSDYSAFGLGPQPELDVTDWLQRGPDGGMVRFYRYSGDAYPAYAPNHRYAACANNPGWQHWLYSVTRLAASCGYDGVFVDNGSSQRCYCRFCRAQFRQFLMARYNSTQLDRLFGLRQPAEITLGQKGDGLLYTETLRFWLETVHKHQAAIAQAGKAVNPQFRVFPNGGHGRPENVKLAFRDSDYVMFEKSVGDYGTHPGLARLKIVGDVAVSKYNDNVYEYKLTVAAGGKPRSLVLTRAGYPRRDPDLELNHWTAYLGMAEAAAFGSGGGFLIRPQYSTFGPALTMCRGFFESHADLYSGYRPQALVSVLHFPEQKLYGNTEHLSVVKRLTRALLDEHVLFEYLMEEEVPAPGSESRRLVVAPGLEYLSRQQLRALEDYVRAGGNLVVVDPTPRADLMGQALRSDLLEPADGQVAGVGDGKVLRLARVPLAGIASRLSQMLGRSVRTLGTADGPAPRWIRANAWRRHTPGPHALVYHILNYATPLGVTATPPELQQGLELRVSAELMDGASAQAFTPERAQAVQLQVATTDGMATVKLPPFRVYTVVTVDSI